MAWAATAAAATGAAVAVLGLLGTGLTGADSHVLGPEEIRAALATATTRTPTTPSATTPSAAASPEATPGATVTPTSQDRLIRSAGGTVIASCADGLVTLRSWSPAQGYSVDSVERGPASEARVEFEPDEGEEVKLRIVCSDEGAGQGEVPTVRPHS
ncbi:hypothetical protein GCM10022224_083750 [Nonomuraea antimicrobica]|uniref:Serine/threonine protein kinase n=1 Tax=Nonomuraea antimicrobica TaxID=561173 RepID=A0ABP7DJG7_9ACTN